MEYATVKESLRRAYDGKAGERDTMEDPPWKRSQRERFRSALRRREAGSLLEIGAGHGVSGRFFADEGLDVTCVDMSAELVERCRAKGLAAEVMDFADLGFADGGFDAVFAMNCLLHVPRAELNRILTEVRRVLRPDGLFYWGQYGGRDFEGVLDTDHYEPKRFFAFMTDANIRAEAAAVFDIVDFHTLDIAPDHTYQALTLTPRR